MLRISQSSFKKDDDILKIIKALSQLPGPAFDKVTPDPAATLMVLQREQAYVNPARNPIRFIGTKRLSDCIFIIFTITDAAAKNTYFAAHIDGNKTYRWDAFFKSLGQCTISATIIGGYAASRAGFDNLRGLLQYLLHLTLQLNLDITIHAQYVHEGFTPTLQDWPQDFTNRLRNKAHVLHKRLFGTDLPAELAQCEFTSDMQAEAAQDAVINSLINALQQDRRNATLQAAVKDKLKMDIAGFSWVDFVDFIIDGDAIHQHMVDALHINARTLAATPASFANLYKKLFSVVGYHAAVAAFSIIGSLPQVKANNFVYDITTQKMSLIPAYYPDGQFALPRRLRINDQRSRDYVEIYHPQDGYRFPAIHPQTLAYFQEVAPQFRDLPKGKSPEFIEAFLKNMMGFGLSTIGINVALDVCWLAHHWSLAPAESLVPPLSSRATQLLTRIQYLNKITGVKFQASGESDAVYVCQHDKEANELELKLKACEIPVKVIDQRLIVENLIKYTKQLSAAVNHKPAIGFAFKF